MLGGIRSDAGELRRPSLDECRDALDEIGTLGELLVAMAVCGILVAGRFRIPCVRVLGQRLATATAGDTSVILVRLGFRAR